MAANSSAFFVRSAEGLPLDAEVETFASEDSAENDALRQVRNPDGREEALVAIDHAVAEARAGHGGRSSFRTSRSGKDASALRSEKSRG